MFTIDDILSQLSSLVGGNSNQAGNWGNGSVSQTGMTFATPENTSNNWSPSTSSTGSPTSGFGMNIGTVGMGLQGLSALGNLLQGNKAQKLAQDQFKFQKQFANTNLNNQIKSYNTALEDRLNSRAVTEGRTLESAAEQIERNRLSR